MGAALRTPSAMPVDTVIANGELLRRAPRVPDYKAEAQALGELAAMLDTSPQSIGQLLVEKTRELLHADSAGLSLAEMEGADRIFRWRAITGEFACYLNGTMPRDFSPCGEVVRRNEPLLMCGMVRAYPYVGELHAPVREALLVPFYDEGVPIGTVWAVHHSEEGHFTAEDLRLLTSLTRFAGVAARMSVLVADLREEGEEHKRQLAQARQADRNKDDFLAQLGHELRNPLNPMKIGLHLIKQGLPAGNSEMHRMHAMVERQMQQIEKLSNGLMDAAAIRSGKIAIHPQPMSLQSAIAGAIEQVNPVCLAREHRLSVEMPEGPLMISGDEGRLVQAFSNLLTNACKYTPNGGNISLRTREAAGEVRIDVEDSGEGIEEADRARIFQMFTQVDARPGQARGGLGIGLALVQQIVELHGGAVAVFSEGKGKGSRFEVRLPRQL